MRSLALLFALLRVTASAEAGTSPPPACPKKADDLRKLTDAEIDANCRYGNDARVTVEAYAGSLAALPLCKQLFKMARQASNVVYATEARQGGFSTEIPGALNQEEAKTTARINLLRLHNFTNVNLAALYRSRLKLRRYLGESERALRQLATDQDVAEKRAVLEEKLRGVPSLQVPRRRRDVNNLAGLKQDLLVASACLDSEKEPLNRAFEDWSKTKQGLLGQDFAKFAPNTGSVTADARELARLQERQRQQQNVYDVLTDPAKRDWAYKTAAICQEANCRTWASISSMIGWAAYTPGVGAVAHAIAGALAYEVAGRQGLPRGQQIREAVNAATPLGMNFLETEVSNIEKGKWTRYEP